jgi:hypothetical protein
MLGVKYRAFRTAGGSAGCQVDASTSQLCPSALAQAMLQAHVAQTTPRGNHDADRHVSIHDFENSVISAEENLWTRSLFRH